MKKDRTPRRGGSKPPPDRTPPRAAPRRDATLPDNQGAEQRKVRR